MPIPSWDLPWISLEIESDSNLRWSMGSIVVLMMVPITLVAGIAIRIQTCSGHMVLVTIIRMKSFGLKF